MPPKSLTSWGHFFYQKFDASLIITDEQLNTCCVPAQRPLPIASLLLLPIQRKQRIKYYLSANLSKLIPPCRSFATLFHNNTSNVLKRKLIISKIITKASQVEFNSMSNLILERICPVFVPRLVRYVIGWLAIQLRF